MLALLAVFWASSVLAQPVDTAPQPQLSLQNGQWEWSDPSAAPVNVGVRHACRMATRRSNGQEMLLRVCLDGRQADDFVYSISIVRDNARIPLAAASLYTHPDLALVMLSDQRFSYFWPVIMAVGGAEGRQLRVNALRAQLQYVRSPPENPTTMDSMIDDGLRRQMAEALVWSLWGEHDRAMAMLDVALPKPDRRGTIAEDQYFEFVAVEIRRSSVHFAAGRIDEGFAVLRAVVANQNIPWEYRTNARVNLAARLVEDGQPAEALEIINAAEAEYGRAGLQAVSGSNRHFAWIRGCALEQLGQHEQAISALAVLPVTPEAAVNPFVPTSSETILVRSERCMVDTQPQLRFMRQNRDLGFPMPDYSWSMLLRDLPSVRERLWQAELRRLATAADGPVQTLRPLPEAWAWLSNDRGRYRDTGVQ